MKRRILFSLLLLFACFAGGGLFASRYVAGATQDLHELIQLHRVENLRRSLVINVQSVQSDLYTLHTPLEHNLDSIVANVLGLEEAAKKCRGCHHSPQLDGRLQELNQLIGRYQEALSYYITTRANWERIERNQLEAASIGHQVLSRAEGMSHAATRHLEKLTLEATERVRQLPSILSLTFAVALLVGAVIAWRLTRSVAVPVAELLAATRTIGEGGLGHTVAWRDGTEFGELADNFNAMSGALEESYRTLEATNVSLEQEVAERRRAEDQLRLNEYRLSSLLELQKMTEASPQEVAEFVLRRAAALTRSQVGFVGFVSEDGDGFVQQAVLPESLQLCTVGKGAAHRRIARAGLWAEALRRKEPILVNDFLNGEPRPHGLPPGHPEITRLLSVPVLDGAQVVGAAALANKEEPYDEGDVQQLTLLMHGMWQHVRHRQMEDHLVRAQKLESVGLLAGGIAHDFNNLLTGILGNVSFAEQKLSADSPARKALAAVDRACERATRLTQQLLTFSKGGAPLRELTDICDLVRDAASFAVSGAKARCEFRIPEQLGAALVDRGQISQVISNLVINAAQAMPEGGTIRVSCENVTLAEGEVPGLVPRDYLRISIADRGEGITKEDLPKVFDPYFTTKSTGSGLGLATSYSIVRQHQGAITVESRVGAGSTFRVYLPATDLHGSEAPSETRSATTGEAPAAGMARARVLVMDDEEAIREVILDVLEIGGCEGTAVADGEQALSHYREALEAGKPFELVILDLTIPGGMGGIEVMQRLRKMDPDVRAIVSSGYSSDPVMADFARYGFRARIAKPYKMDSFLEVVERVLDNQAV